jgi:hypothetical protein
LIDPAPPAGYGDSQAPSPPPASGVRRHQSLNYPNAAGSQRLGGGLKRAGTLQAPPIKVNQSQGYPAGQSPSPTNADEDEDEGLDEDPYFPPNQYPTSPMGRTSPWATPGSGSNEWRQGGNGNSVDDVSRALNALELSQSYQGVNYQQQGQSAHPPRFNPSHPPPQNAPGLRRGSQSGSSTPGVGVQMAASGRGLQLVTDFDGRTSHVPQGSVGGPASASAYVPPIGHGPGQPAMNQQYGNPPQQVGRDRALTASGTTTWDQKERVLGGRASNPNLQYGYQSAQGNKGGNGIPNVPPIPSHYLNQSQAPRLGPSTTFAAGGNDRGQNGGNGGNGGSQPQLGTDGVSTPVDVPTLLATKGYNPVDFDIKPIFVSISTSTSRAPLTINSGALLCHQVLYRRRCSQVVEI